MQITEAEVLHFELNGFFLVPNPFGADRMAAVASRQQKVAPLWEGRDFPEGCNRLACQFLMVGEPVLRLVEQPELVDLARRLLGTDQIHVGACGLGDASMVDRAGKGAGHQVHWHADGGPEVKQVSLRTALDRHDVDNGPLRVLPGTQYRPRDEVAAELLQLELASGVHDDPPDLCYARHPREIELILDPRWTLVWTPSCWHATGVKRAQGPRRAMSWNYFPAGGRKRDVVAIKHVVPDWEEWSDDRRRLWGLLDAD